MHGNDTAATRGQYLDLGLQAGAFIPIPGGCSFRPVKK